MIEAERLQGWVGKIKAIDDEVQQLFFQSYIFWEVQDIIKNNERLSRTPSHFFDWLREVFAYSSTMFVRRQADRSKGTISFYKLLEEIHRYPNLLTRGRFLKAWGYSEEDVFALETKREGDELFDEAVGRGRDYLTKAEIKADMEALLANVKIIEDYANQYVAHRCEKPMPSDLPTFKSLKNTMSFLEKMLQKYYLIITGWKMLDTDIGSTLEHDWKSIFTFPWIEPEGTIKQS